MTLLPKAPGLRLENAAIDADSVEFTLASTSLPVACPVCGKQTTRLHSHYRRAVADLPWGGRQVRLLLNVRKFRCPRKECPRRVFTERLPNLVEPHARKTTRLQEVLELVGFALGGNAGARLIRRLGMEASPTTLLRCIRGAAVVDHPPPEVIGVDDFSLRRGDKGATIIVDLERRCPIEILRDCSATLAGWLEANPSAQTISRNGAREYARGIADGAPEALQIADRWHLLKNLREVLEKALQRERKLLAVRGEIPEDARDEASKRAEEAGDKEDASLDDLLGSYSSWANRAERRRRQERRTARLEQYRRAVELKERGTTLKDISEEVGVGVRALYRWFAAGSFPQRQPRRDKGPRLPKQVAEHLVRRWNEGCHNVQKLYARRLGNSASGVRSYPSTTSPAI
jgi:transposase